MNIVVTGIVIVVVLLLGFAASAAGLRNAATEHTRQNQKACERRTSRPRRHAWTCPGDQGKLV